MNPYLNPIPLGQSLPLNNPHAVSVSLPTMADVKGYEENDPAVKNKMQSGYPRFFLNKFLVQLCNYVRNENLIDEKYTILPLMSQHALESLQRKFGRAFSVLFRYENIFVLCRKENTLCQEMNDFVRHTGILISSRKAEEILFQLNVISEKFNETVLKNSDPEIHIKSVLCEAYHANDIENIQLTCSGMNAVYSVFENIVHIQKTKGKNTIIQAGWLYLDTFEIIRKYSAENMLLTQVSDAQKLEDEIKKNHQHIAAVFTEVPTNPLLDCVDLPALYSVCKKYSIPLIVDSTIGTPFNITVLPYCDLAVESLTKFACGNGDIMMGAIICNPESVFAREMKHQIFSYAVHPFIGDLARLALHISDYEQRVIQISKNTKVILEYLEKSSSVKQIFSVIHKNSSDNFKKIRRSPESFPGLISVVFEKDLEYYYDKLHLPKGPSLGTEFTLAMPYMYLAHYDLVKTESGRAQLIKMGLHPELLRISVGTEPPSEIINVLKAAGI